MKGEREVRKEEKKYCTGGILLLTALILVLMACGNTAVANRHFTVSLEADGGIPEPTKLNVQEGSLISEPEAMVRRAMTLATGTETKLARSCGILEAKL
jgi:hypothetical protein